MAFLTFFSILFFFFTFFLQKPTAAQTCSTSCPAGGQEIKFPFGLNRNGNLNGRCSYPGFGLSCSNITGEAVINLPESGVFTVRSIDYEAQQIWIDDPDRCLAERLLRSFNVSGTPFESELWEAITFFNCSAAEAEEAGFRRITCLSDQNYSVVVSLFELLVDSNDSIPSFCRPIRTVTVPLVWHGWWEGIPLEWYNPDCRSCVERQLDCQFKNRTSREIGCFNLRSKVGLPRSAKYGIIIGVGIPGLLCLIGLISFVGSRLRRYGRRSRDLPSSFEFSTLISPSPAIIVAGLDGPTIESYPKTKLGESRRLPKPNDNTCPICLSEYQPKETLRTIPECNHYFHADCIDEWLKMNGSCPLCRNSPGGSAAITPSISSLSSSSSSSVSTP